MWLENSEKVHLWQIARDGLRQITWDGCVAKKIHNNIAARKMIYIPPSFIPRLLRMKHISIFLSIFLNKISEFQNFTNIDITNQRFSFILWGPKIIPHPWTHNEHFLLGYFGNIHDLELWDYRDVVIGLCQQGLTQQHCWNTLESLQLANWGQISCTNSRSVVWAVFAHVRSS